MGKVCQIGTYLHHTSNQEHCTQINDDADDANDANSDMDNVAPTAKIALAELDIGQISQNSGPYNSVCTTAMPLRFNLATHSYLLLYPQIHLRPPDQFAQL